MNNPPPCSDAAGEHASRCLSTDSRGVDLIDRMKLDDDFDDLIEIDPHVTGTNNRRSERELAKLLEVIDNLPISTNGKEGRA